MYHPCKECKDRYIACQDKCIKKLSYELVNMEYAETEADKQWKDYTAKRKVTKKPPKAFQNRGRWHKEK